MFTEGRHDAHDARIAAGSAEREKDKGFRRAEHEALREIAARNHSGHASRHTQHEATAASDRAALAEQLRALELWATEANATLTAKHDVLSKALSVTDEAGREVSKRSADGIRLTLVVVNATLAALGAEARANCTAAQQSSASRFELVAKHHAKLLQTLRNQSAALTAQAAASGASASKLTAMRSEVAGLRQAQEAVLSGVTQDMQGMQSNASAAAITLAGLQTALAAARSEVTGLKQAQEATHAQAIARTHSAVKSATDTRAHAVRVEARLNASLAKAGEQLDGVVDGVVLGDAELRKRIDAHAAQLSEHSSQHEKHGAANAILHETAAAHAAALRAHGEQHERLAAHATRASAEGASLRALSAQHNASALVLLSRHRTLEAEHDEHKRSHGAQLAALEADSRRIRSNHAVLSRLPVAVDAAVSAARKVEARLGAVMVDVNGLGLSRSAQGRKLANVTLQLGRLQLANVALVNVSATLNAHEKMIQDDRAGADGLEGEVASLIAALATAEVKAKRLAAANRQEMAELSASAGRSQAQVAAAARAADEAEDSAAGVASRLHRLENKMLRLQGLPQLEEEAAQEGASASLNETRRLMNETRAEVEALVSQVAITTASNFTTFAVMLDAAMREEKAQTARRVTANSERLRRLEQGFTERHELLEASGKDLHGICMSAVGNQTANMTPTSAFSSLEASLASGLGESRAHAAAQRAENSAAVGQLRKSLTQLEAQLSAVQRGQVTAESSLQGRIDTLQTELFDVETAAHVNASRLQAESKAHASQRRALEGTLYELQSAQSEMPDAAALAALRRKLGALRSSHEALSSGPLAEAEARLKEVASANFALKRQLSAHAKQHEATGLVLRKHSEQHAAHAGALSGYEQRHATHEQRHAATGLVLQQHGEKHAAHAADLARQLQQFESSR